jgi:hypothetical protein
MSQTQRIVGCGLFAVAAMLFGSPAAFGQHLDRFQAKRVVRAVEERTDDLQDRMDEWVLDRLDERVHRTQDLYHRMNRFAAALDDLKGQLRDREEPWDVRDQARTVMAAAGDLGSVIEGGDWPDEFRHGWHEVRDHLNDLAKMYRLHEYH